jgi:predicted AAA+ superfamily ATPase
MRLEMEFVPRFFTAPRGSFFLFGPRGTGKSLWTQVTFPEALRLDLLDPQSVHIYSARPTRLRELINGTPTARHVVIDEVQKVPELLPVVHALIEERRRLQFVLTGSSARKLKRSGVDLLAGRAVLRSKASLPSTCAPGWPTARMIIACSTGARSRVSKWISSSTAPPVYGR